MTASSRRATPMLDIIKNIAALRGVDINTIEHEPTNKQHSQDSAVTGVKLKDFPNGVACLPNEWVRSGLFSASNKIRYQTDPRTNEKHRIMFRHEQVPTWSENVKIFYTGEELNLFDLKIWLTCLRIGKKEFLGNEITMTPYEFIKEAKITRGGKNIDLAYESLKRIHQSSIESRLYKNGERFREYNDHLIHWFDVKSDTGKWVISLNPRLKKLFDAQTTWIDWQIWNSFKGEIPKALMLQICSHEARSNNPQRIPLSKLKELMRNGQPMFEFRRLIKTHGAKLIDVGVVKQCKLENDVLIYTRGK